MQYLFICDWNFCSGKKLPVIPEYFCSKKTKSKAILQIAASGSYSDSPTIMYALLKTISPTKKELLITSPYFISSQTILDAICEAAMRGVHIKLLVSLNSDSALVNAAARSYYSEVLDAGVELYLYKKGFVNAKTVVADGQLAIVGTANMDHRSFELYFEVNA